MSEISVLANIEEDLEPNLYPNEMIQSSSDEPMMNQPSSPANSVRSATSIDDSDASATLSASPSAQVSNRTSNAAVDKNHKSPKRSNISQASKSSKASEKQAPKTQRNRKPDPKPKLSSSRKRSKRSTLSKNISSKPLDQPIKSGILSKTLSGATSLLKKNTRITLEASPVQKEEPEVVSKKRKLFAKPKESSYMDDISNESETEEFVNGLHLKETNEFANEFDERYRLLRTLRDLPPLSELSDTLSEDIPMQEIVAVQESEKHSYDGHYVDPLQRGYSSEDEEEEFMIYETAAEHSDLESSSPSYLTISSLISPAESHHSIKSQSHKQVEMDELAYLVMEHMQPHIADSMDSDTEEFQRIYTTGGNPLVAEICMSFLSGIIDVVVEQCENYELQLPLNLDKYKMVDELRKLVESYSIENYRYEQLDKKCVELYMRKKQLSLITTPKDRDKVSESRCRHALIRLDRWLKIKASTQAKVQKCTSDLREQKEIALQTCAQVVHDLEMRIRDTLLGKEKDTASLRRSVDEKLQLMNDLRNDIGDVRLWIIAKQHQYADTKAKSDQIVLRGGGYKIREYLAMMNEVNLLSKKLEERTADLNRYRNSINFNIHGLAHMKCKGQIVRKTLAKTWSKLKAKEEYKDHYRERLFKYKMVHNKVLNAIKDIKSRNTIIYYPPLMRDYDETMELIDRKRSKVLKLRSEYERLRNRLEQLQKEQHEQHDFL